MLVTGRNEYLIKKIKENFNPIKNNILIYVIDDENEKDIYNNIEALNKKNYDEIILIQEFSSIDKKIRRKKIEPKGMSYKKINVLNLFGDKEKNDIISNFFKKIDNKEKLEYKGSLEKATRLIYIDDFIEALPNLINNELDEINVVGDREVPLFYFLESYMEVKRQKIGTSVQKEKIKKPFDFNYEISTMPYKKVFEKII